MKKETRGGRPPKFNEESAPVTVTLPRRILEILQDIDKDRAKAIVKCVDQIACGGRPEKRTVEVVKVSNDTGLLVVPPSRSLKSISWLQLVEIAPLRCMMVIPSGSAIEALEITLVDLIEHIPDGEIDEKMLLMDLRKKLSRFRRKEGLSKGEVLFITTD